ncbi:hypothetical protein GCM10011531_28280 [Aquaticitalea lipolytica]|uniref:Beta-barrel porin n=1 Tax=Aquaticitalea lipolytica TaxID=1247562 RepID=A0A8J2TSS9_9FLAO|nr:putative porin [Aquaticitalea lipolytica]GFZ95059.1 hypothetical protein GCM10011531_28280 [Aquaticitalea lipolytica]
MKNFFYFFTFLLFCQSFNAQNLTDATQLKRQGVINDTTNNTFNNRSSNTPKKLAKIEQYKIVSFKNDTTFVDTTLSIKKDYKFNYLREDNFNLIQFSNVGQTYNTLSEDFSNTETSPLFGARARHFNYMEVSDINYYQVPTPLTELFYKTAFSQGQLLDAFFTVNTSKQFNLSLAYKGLRSLGKYQHILTSTGNFRFTSNYVTKNNKYSARAHIVMQDLLNQENGGLTDADIDNFESGAPEFIDRSVFNPNFENAENILEGKRFFLEQKFNIINSKDSLSYNSLSIGNIISFEDKYYQFKQTISDDFFGDAFRSNDLDDKVTLENLVTKTYLNFNNNTIGDITFNLEYNKYNYGYNSVIILQDQAVKSRLKGEVLSIGGVYRKSFGNFNLSSEAALNIIGDFKGNFIDVNVGYKINDDVLFNGTLNLNSTMPNYNYLLYQSDYINYNWDNSNIFKNINTKQIAVSLQSNKLANITLDYTNIDNYTYFTKNSDNQVKPFQYQTTINYLRVKANKEFSYGKFALDNTIMYQQVINGEHVLNVPQIISRNTLYFSDHLFKNAMFLQTGITLNYFTEYNMNSYDPLLAEFYTQNETKIGAFPRLDFFINAKIRQTRIYLKAEHFNSSLTGYNYYSAPNYPYRDFTVRFGIVWNFFL